MKESTEQISEFIIQIIYFGVSNLVKICFRIELTSICSKYEKYDLTGRFSSISSQYLRSINSSTNSFIAPFAELSANGPDSHDIYPGSGGPVVLIYQGRRFHHQLPYFLISGSLKSFLPIYDSILSPYCLFCRV